MIVTDNKLQEKLREQYKRAQIDTFDNEYHVVEAHIINKAYSQFIWQMRLIGLHMWLKNKLDCDKWAWLFKAYIIVRNALSKRNHAVPVGVLSYFVNGDPSRSHMINTYLHYDNNKLTITELEPQPNSGSKQLTQEERDSAWFVAF